MTSEPGLDQRFYEAFMSTCVQHGIDCLGGDIDITVNLKKYQLVTRSLKNDYSSEYSVVIKASVTIRYPDGKVESLDKLSSEFDESFIAQNTVEEISANQELVANRALEGLSKRILNLIIHKQARQ